MNSQTTQTACRAEEEGQTSARFTRKFDAITIDDIRSRQRNPAVKKTIAEVIVVCRRKGRKIGICGQAPERLPGVAQFLVEQGIDSISLNPDTVLKTTVAILEKEKNGNERRGEKSK